MTGRAGAIAVAAASGAVAGVRWWALRSPLPRTRGRLEVDGLAESVVVTRDAYGVPHVAAETLSDAVFAQGFVHAQDRLWQMELARRAGAGRLAELLGREAVEVDRHVRRLGLARAARAELDGATADERRVLDAYAAGVNASIASHRRRRPLELRLLRARPEPWTALDTVICMKLLALGLASNWDAEVVRLRLLERLGPERAARVDELLSGATAPGPAPARPPDDLRELARLAPALVGMGASNSWALAGSRTASGRPLLASDPHVLPSLPCAWYENHLRHDGADVYGVSVPGVPLVVLGHNANVAWGATNSFVDVQDAVVERFDDRDRYERDGRWLQAVAVDEQIAVRRGDPVTERVLHTDAGPVVAGGPVAGASCGLALEWTGLDPSHTLAALMAMNAARDADEFREALREWAAPVLDFVFADVHGAIGRQVAGRVPLREGLDGLPRDGATRGPTRTVPFDELPGERDPECGYVLSANSARIANGSRHALGHDWLDDFRGARIERVLAAAVAFEPDDCRRLQLDQHSEAGLAFARRCADLRPARPRERRTLEELLAWDGDASADSVGAAVYAAMSNAAFRRALEPALGPELVADLLGSAQGPLASASTLLGRHTGMLLRMLDAPEPPFADGARAGWDGLLADALSDATELLERRLGADPATWRWGRLHVLRLRHPFGVNALLGRLFNGPPVPVGGDAHTVCQTAYLADGSFAAEGWMPSWRQVVDLGDRGASGSVLCAGQSGHVRSRHYLDMLPLWREGRLHEQWLAPEDATHEAEALLVLDAARAAGNTE